MQHLQDCAGPPPVDDRSGEAAHSLSEFLAEDGRAAKGQADSRAQPLWGGPVPQQRCQDGGHTACASRLCC